MCGTRPIDHDATGIVLLQSSVIAIDSGSPALRSSSALENAITCVPFVTSVHGPTSWRVGVVTTSGAIARSSFACSRGPVAILARLARLGRFAQQVTRAQRALTSQPLRARGLQRCSAMSYDRTRRYRIVVGVDLTEYSHIVIEHALDQAARHQSPELHFVHVQESRKHELNALGESLSAAVYPALQVFNQH